MSEDLMQYNKTAALIGVGPTGALRPENFEGLWRMSQIFAASGFMPKGMERVESIFVAVQLGMEVGLSPMAAVQNIACINGRPTIWGDAMLGLVRGCGQLERIKEDLIGAGDAATAICTVWRKGEVDPAIGRFSVADAKRAQLWDKAGPWKQFPNRMLQMRARGFALRDKFSDVLKGLYTREEIEPEQYMGAAEVVSDARAAVADIQRAAAKRGPAPVAAQEPKEAPREESQAPEAPASAEWPKTHRDNLYDARGVVWDGLVHSGAKTCNADGTWRRRKGVHPDQVAAAEARYPRIDVATASGQGPAAQGPGLADALCWMAAAQDLDELDVSVDASRDIDLSDGERDQVIAAAAAQRTVLEGR